MKTRFKFSRAETDAIIKGFVPDDMSQRWHITYEAPWLSLKRSWTGHEVYKSRLVLNDDGSSEVAEVLIHIANDWKTATENDCESVSELIVSLLLP